MRPDELSPSQASGRCCRAMGGNGPVSHDGADRTRWLGRRSLHGWVRPVEMNTDPTDRPKKLGQACPTKHGDVPIFRGTWRVQDGPGIQKNGIGTMVTSVYRGACRFQVGWFCIHRVQLSRQMYMCIPFSQIHFGRSFCRGLFGIFFGISSSGPEPLEGWGRS